MTATFCAKCNTILRLRTDPRKVLVLSSGAVVCDKCYWEEKGRKKGSGSRGRGFKPPTQPRGNIVNA